MLHIRRYYMLRTVFLIATFLLPASAQSAPPASRPSQPPPADITALYGNTVEIVVEVSANPEYGTPPYEMRFWRYMVKDGSRILGSSEAFEGEDRGTTFGHDERICIEQKLSGYTKQVIMCGSFSVQGHIVTTNLDMKSWDTERLQTLDGQIEMVFSVDGPGRCSFLGRRSVLTSDLGTARPVWNTGSCRILEGRRMELPDGTSLRR